MPPTPPFPSIAALYLRPLGDHRLRCDEKGCDGSSALQRQAHDLSRVDDAGLHHVGIAALLRVISVVGVVFFQEPADGGFGWRLAPAHGFVVQKLFASAIRQTSSCRHG